jgi:hypothetical protein
VLSQRFDHSFPTSFPKAAAAGADLRWRLWSVAPSAVTGSTVGVIRSNCDGSTVIECGGSTVGLIRSNCGGSTVVGSIVVG